MLAKRIIPCLDVKDGRTVKGTNFVGLRDAGDIVELASRYSIEGADELVFLDITASADRRGTMTRWVESVARAIDIPFTVGGGISSEKDVEALLARGADKVSINSSAVSDPGPLCPAAPPVRQPMRGGGHRCPLRGRPVGGLCQGRKGTYAVGTLLLGARGRAARGGRDPVYFDGSRRDPCGVRLSGDGADFPATLHPGHRFGRGRLAGDVLRCFRQGVRRCGFGGRGIPFRATDHRAGEAVSVLAGHSGALVTGGGGRLLPGRKELEGRCAIKEHSDAERERG